MIEKVFRKGNKYYERVRTDGNQSLIREFTPEFTCFKVDNEGDYSNITNLEQKASKFSFHNAQDYNKFTKTYEDFGQILGKRGPLYNHIYKNYWKKQTFRTPRIMFLDIEVIEVGKKGFPHPHLAETKITHIQMLDSFTGKVIIISDRHPSQKLIDKYPDVKMIECANDTEILKTFAIVLKKINPTIVTAYNGMFFDFPYLVMRALKLGLNPSMFSPVNKYDFSVEFKENNFKKLTNLRDVQDMVDKGYKPFNYNINWEGLYLIDYLDVYKKFSMQQLPNFTLEAVTKHELNEGEGKASYKQFNSIIEFFEKDYDGFYEYSIIDVLIMQRLEKKRDFFGLMGMMAHEMGCNIDDIMGTIKPWDAMLTNLSLSKNICMPRNEERHLDKPILGGFVRDPVKGKHQGVISVDYNSLYPSIMSSLNICPSTYIPYEKLPLEAQKIYDYFMDEDESKFINDPKMRAHVKEVTHKYDIVFAGTAFYKKGTRGIIADIIHELYFERKSDKYKMLVSDAEHQNIKEYLINKGIEIKDVAPSDNKNIIKLIDDGTYTLDKKINLDEFSHDGLLALLPVLEDYSGNQDSLQQSKKIRLNSLYGALSTPYFILFNRDIAASITFMGRSLIQDTGNRIGRSFKDNDSKVLYQDTDSVYISVPSVFNRIYDNIEPSNRKFYNLNEDNKHKFIKDINEWIGKYLDPEIEGTVADLIDTMNLYHQDFMGAKVEKINTDGIFVAKKRYALATMWNEGTVYYGEPKLSFTGLEVVRSSTPPWSITNLKSTIKTLLMGSNQDVQNHFKVVKQDFYDKIRTPDNFERFARTSSLNNLSYEKDRKGWFRINENGVRVACPIASRASLTHNEIIQTSDQLATENVELQIGEKIKYFYLDPENKYETDLIGYINPKFMVDTNLINSIDIDKTFEKIFIKPLETITSVMDVEFESKSNLASFDLF